MNCIGSPSKCILGRKKEGLHAYICKVLTVQIGIGIMKGKKKGYVLELQKNRVQLRPQLEYCIQYTWGKKNTCINFTFGKRLLYLNVSGIKMEKGMCITTTTLHFFFLKLK